MTQNQALLNGLSFDIRKSVAYHDHRRSYYMRMDNAVKLLGLVVASAVFTENFGADTLAKILAACFAVVSAASIVHRFGAMEHLHDSLYKQFINLQQKLVQMDDPTRSDLRQLRMEVLKVESMEPPPYAALNRYCHNQICRLDEDDDFQQPLRLHEKLLMNVFKFPNLRSVPVPAKESGTA